MLRLVIITALALILPRLAVAAEETRKMPPFSAVTFAGKGELVMRVGEDQSLTLDADSDLLRGVTTEVHGSTLEIKRKKNTRSWNIFSFLQWLGSSSFDSDQPLRVTITVPRLTALTVDGTAKVQAEGFDGGDTAITVSGAAQLEGRGRLDTLGLRITGAGDAKLGGLIATKADVSITGAGNVVVQPTQALHAAISGAGSIKYIGDPPEVTRNVTGMGSIQKQ